MSNKYLMVESIYFKYINAQITLILIPKMLLLVIKGDTYLICP